MTKAKAAAKKKPAAKTPQTGAERIAALRARRAEIMHAEVRGVFAHLDDHPVIKEQAAKIVRRRERSAKKAAA